jgi:predicted NAD-dependent protein-ADP-ribosyltransferase YbiA (DUF1768 family)
MRVLPKDGLIVFVPDNEVDVATLRALSAGSADHVFHLVPQGAEGFVLHDLGPRAEACAEPINIHSGMADERLRVIGNFAATPFELDGLPYASVEGFWQSLKYLDEADRRRVAALHGIDAKQAGDAATPQDVVIYQGRSIPFGRPAHWAVMERACKAKFTQHATARDALLSTGTRPLQHRVRPDSVTIPGVIMADIWMRIRSRLAPVRP